MESRILNKKMFLIEVDENTYIQIIDSGYDEFIVAETTLKVEEFSTDNISTMCTSEVEELIQQVSNEDILKEFNDYLETATV